LIPVERMLVTDCRMPNQNGEPSETARPVIARPSRVRKIFTVALQPLR
jgi:hypothetical protein